MGKFAYYNPESFPEGGFCISSFALIRRGNEILLGKPLKHARWEKEWSPNWTVYPKERLEREFTVWRFPSAYLMEGEHPDTTLNRILKDQLQVAKFSIANSKLYSFYELSTWRPGKMHWDFCFVSEVNIQQEVKKPEWFAELAYKDTKRMTREEFGSSQGDLAAYLGLTSD